MIWNIRNIGLNTVHYTVLLHFLLLLLGYCFFERKKIRDYSYRYFVYSLTAIIFDGLFILLALHTFGRVSARLCNVVTFLILLCHSLCMAFLLKWFFKTMEERGLVCGKAVESLCGLLLALSLLINFALSFRPEYSLLVFGRDALAPPNLFSSFYSFTIIGIVLTFSIKYRRALPMAPVLCVLFLLLTPQILLLSDMRLHAACALYTTVAFFIVHRHYWSLAQQKREQEENEIRVHDLVVMRQILPHFVFNCLGSIEVLCEKAPAKAQQAVAELAQLLRDTMGEMGSDEKKPFPEILGIVSSYVRLEQMRFGSRLRVEYDIEETGFSLPPLILQPLVENAVRHGLAGRREGGTVRISTRRESGRIVIRVEDDGVGIPPEENGAARDAGAPAPGGRASHIGLDNVRRRLKLLCGGTVEVQSEPGVGTAVTLRIPSEK